MVETTTTTAVKSEQGGGGGGGGLFLPPGFRFHPTDEEIITSYLVKKFLNPSFTSLAVGEVDLNHCEPWDLPSKATMGEKEWYFFCHKDMKYPTGMRTNRATKEGYWKATGKDREIFTAAMNGDNHKQQQKQLIGMKKTLVFYMGRAPKGSRTNWVMHEFRVDGNHRDHNANRRANPKDEWVVCKVFQKKGEAKTTMAAAAVEYSAGTPNNGSSVEAGEGGGGDCFQLDSIIDPSMYLNSSAMNVNVDYSINSAAVRTNSDTSGLVDVLPNYTTFNTSNMHVPMNSVLPTSSTSKNSYWEWNDQLIPSGSRAVLHGMGGFNGYQQDDGGHQVAAMVKTLGGVISGGPTFSMPPSSSKGLPSSAMAGVLSQQNYVGAPQNKIIGKYYSDPYGINQITGAAIGHADDNSLVLH